MEAGWNKSILKEYVYETENINVRETMTFEESNFNIRYGIEKTFHDKRVAQGIGNAIADDPEAINNAAILIAHSKAPNDPAKRKKIYSYLNVQGSQSSDDDITSGNSPLISVNPLNDKSSESRNFANTTSTMQPNT